MKKKSRWQRILLWSSLGLVIILITSLFVINYAMDKVLNSMSGMDTILNEVEAVEDEVGESVDSADVSSDISNVPDVPDAADNLADGKSIELDGTASNNNTSKEQSDPKSPKTELTASQTEPTYKAEVSTETAQDIQEDASISEKATVASLVMKNLSASDIKLLASLASGGLSLDEKKEARSLILQKLSEDEYNRLIEIAQKYGVSQGKQYDEVIKEEQ